MVAAMRRIIRALSVLWPSFVTAGVLEMLVFAVVDPQTLMGSPEDSLHLSRQAVYSITFFVFWGVISIGGWVTAILAQEVYRSRD